MEFRKLFRAKPKHRVRLSSVDPSSTDGIPNQDVATTVSINDLQQIKELQYKLFAENQQSLLICLQALDAAGKDGTIKHVFNAMNPQGTQVHGFKAPSAEEAAHDFLWRAHLHAPAKGQIEIFNRSHYEDVLVVRVHNLVSKSVWSERFDLINDFEHNLAANGTRILKFFLHISEDEQLKRFEQRLDDPSRHWKISESDYSERKLWPKYVEAYEEVFHRTSTKHAPWFIIPSNHKWFRNFAVAKIVLETLKDMNMTLPKPIVDIERIRRQYHSSRHRESRLKKRIREEE